MKKPVNNLFLFMVNIMSHNGIVLDPKYCYKRHVGCKKCGNDIYYIKSNTCALCQRIRIAEYAKKGTRSFKTGVVNEKIFTKIDLKDKWCPAEAWTNASRLIKE